MNRHTPSFAGPPFGEAFPDPHVLPLIETCGLTGSWNWRFLTDEQTCSPGLCRLLGLGAGIERPDYDLFLNLVHPEDRPVVEAKARLMRDGMFDDHTLRVIRPDGTLRMLTCRGIAYVTPEGRPRAAAGLVLDVTDAGRLADLHREEQRRRRCLFEQAQIWTHASPCGTSFRVASRELLSLTGLSQQEFHDDWTRVLVPEERASTRDRFAGLLATGRPFVVEQHLLLRGGETGRFRGVFAPVRDADGRIETWASLNSRVGGIRPVPTGPARRGLEQAVQGPHLRAARGLLDWSMADLAAASGLSLSTVRRLEAGGEGPLARSRQAVLSALRAAGIGFVFIDGATLAVVKVR